MLDSAKQLTNSLFDSIDASFNHLSPVKRLAERTNLRPSYFILAFFLITLISLGTGIFSHICVTLFGMIYPSYMTFKVPLPPLRPSNPRTTRRPKNGSPTG